jgi:transcriptional regulator with XRE-family HTH domain
MQRDGNAPVQGRRPGEKMTPPQINIRADIASIIRERGITISELHRVSGVSRANISNWIGGNTHSINIETFAKLLTALGIDRITYHQGESKCRIGRKKRTLTLDPRPIKTRSRKCR